MRTFATLLAALFLTTFAATAGAEEPSDLEETLVFLVEEEKLANNLYDALHAKFEHRTHGHIKESETRHMQAVGRLLAARKIENPVAKAPRGKFTVAELQKLYDDLLARGSKSLTEALAVGALVEERDIADLTLVIDDAQTPDDVSVVLKRLRRASYNHLDGFTSAWEAETGKKYEPALLEAAAYKAARAAGAEHHRQMRGKGKGKGHGKGGGPQSCEY